MSICHPDVSIPNSVSDIVAYRVSSEEAMSPLPPLNGMFSVAEGGGKLTNNVERSSELFEGMVDYKSFTDCSIKEIINDYLEKNDNHHAFFLIDINQIVKLYELWNDYLPNIKPYYAVKCNPDPHFITMLSKLGVNFDCASKKEIELVNDIVCDPSRIIYANPCKQFEYISYAEEKSVDLMTFDCEIELCKIKLCHPNARLLLRIAVDDSGSLVKFSTKFGCKPENIEQLLVTAKKEGMNVVGFSFHVGSGCRTPYQYYNAIHECKKATLIAEKLGMKCSIIDVGGGFPGNNSYLFNDIAQSIHQAMDDFFTEEVEQTHPVAKLPSELVVGGFQPPDHKTVEFIAEPGRFFAESTHTLVVNIIGKKISSTNDGPIEYMYYINDGVYGSFNCLMFDHAQPVIMSMRENNGSKTFPSKIFGPTCDSIDVVAEKVMLPELHIGDRLYLENFGAYTCAASSEFNGMERPVKYYISRE
jgi:diaminopimelate decarboxylase